MAKLRMRDFVTLKVTGSENKKRLFECKDASSASGHSLLVHVAGTHAGVLNGNQRFYRPDRMQDSTHTWVQKGRPAKPVLVRHDKDCDPLGRVASARYVDLSYKWAGDKPRVKETLFYDARKKMDLYKSVDWVIDNLQGKEEYEGLGYIDLGLSVTNPEAIRKIQSDEYLTVSVGFSTDSALCSACHTDWAVDDRCEHRLGQMVDGRRVFLIAGGFDYEEVSFVNFPADPFAAVTNKQVVSAVKDSLATRAYFLGMSQADQTKLGLSFADHIEDLGFESDITAMVEDSEPKHMTTLEQISADLKADGLTKEKAVELQTQLAGFTSEDATEIADAKRLRSTLAAVVKSNGWDAQATEQPTRESVEARIAGLDAVLADLDEAGRAQVLGQLETDANALGIEFRPPAPASTTEPAAAAAQAEGAVAAEDAAATTEFNAQSFVDAEMKGKAKTTDYSGVVTALDGLHKAYHAIADEDKYLVRGTISALLEHWYSGSNLAYYMSRMQSSDQVNTVIERKELDTLHKAIENYETDAKKCADDRSALLDSNKALVKSRKRDMARALVTISALTDGSYKNKTQADIEAEVESKSQRFLVSLSDALEDAFGKLPANLQAASTAQSHETVKEVSDNARVTEKVGKDDVTTTDAAATGQEATDQSESESASQVFPVTGIRDLRRLREHQAAETYRRLKENTAS